MDKPKLHSCKVGTQPWLVVIKGNAKPELGKILTFRSHEVGSKWVAGIVDKINPDGYFFVELM